MRWLSPNPRGGSPGRLPRARPRSHREEPRPGAGREGSGRAGSRARSGAAGSLPARHGSPVRGRRAGSRRSGGRRRRRSESTPAVRTKLRGRTPGHLGGVVGGDHLVVLGHLGRPPATHASDQTTESGVGARILAELKARAVVARLDLRELIGEPFSLRDRLRESGGARWTELHRDSAFHVLSLALGHASALVGVHTSVGMSTRP